MKTLNFFGMSYHFAPDSNIETGNVNSEIIADKTVSGNKIYFFDGVLPEVETLYEIQNEADLLEQFGDSKIMQVTDLDFNYSYDVVTKERQIRKVPVDALDVPIEKDGTIGWAAIVLATEDGIEGNTIIFTDSIGVWGDQLSPIIIDRVGCTAGENNIFKDISIIFRDVSSNEGA